MTWFGLAHDSRGADLDKVAVSVTTLGLARAHAHASRKEGYVSGVWEARNWIR